MIDCYRPLVAIAAQVEARVFGRVAVRAREERRAILARVVAHAWALNLDHFGAQIAEQLAGEGRRENPAHVQDADSCKCGGWHW